MHDIPHPCRPHRAELSTHMAQSYGRKISENFLRPDGSQSTRVMGAEKEHWRNGQLLQETEHTRQCAQEHRRTRRSVAGAIRLLAEGPHPLHRPRAGIHFYFLVLVRAPTRIDPQFFATARGSYRDDAL